MKILITLVLVFLATRALACTSIFLNFADNPTVAKNQDWSEGQGFAYINKRNVEKTAAVPAPIDRWFGAQNI